MADLSQAAADVFAERRRQIEVEGWTAEHDAQHGDGSLARAAAAYASYAGTYQSVPASRYQTIDGPADWPWHRRWWKPRDPRRDLVRAAALIIAEIERLDGERNDG